MDGTLTHEPVGLLELLDCKGQGREVSERTTISSFHPWKMRREGSACEEVRTMLPEQNVRKYVDKILILFFQTCEF